MVEVTILADSLSPQGTRLTTMEISGMHRWVLAEFNTHRLFSRNSASSRAIPVHKTLAEVIADPAKPVEWPAELPGMQGGPPLEGDDLAFAMRFYDFIHEKVWREVDAYVKMTEGLPRLHKSVLNRFLEPFMYHKVIVTSTDWSNFFAQRCSPLAQPEIRVTAEAMREALYDSTPMEVRMGGWHLPYSEDLGDMENLPAIKISVARCTRVSYLNHGTGVKDHDEDLRLYERLVTADPMHASPLEHVATPAGLTEIPDGNFRGWHQWRHMVQNPQDSRG